MKTRELVPILRMQHVCMAVQGMLQKCYKSLVEIAGASAGLSQRCHLGSWPQQEPLDSSFVSGQGAQEGRSLLLEFIGCVFSLRPFPLPPNTKKKETKEEVVRLWGVSLSANPTPRRATPKQFVPTPRRATPKQFVPTPRRATPTEFVPTPRASNSQNNYTSISPSLRHGSCPLEQLPRFFATQVTPGFGIQPSGRGRTCWAPLSCRWERGWSLVIVSSWVGFRVGLGWWLGFGLF